MDPATRAAGDIESRHVEVRVHGPDCAALSPADLRRLFPSGALTEGRLDRLRTWSLVTVCCDQRVAALATCQKIHLELRVPEVGLDLTCGCGPRQMVGVLLDALELAALAGGCRRLVVMPPRGMAPFLEDRGYATLAECCAGGWLEKSLG